MSTYDDKASSVPEGTLGVEPNLNPGQRTGTGTQGRCRVFNKELVASIVSQARDDFDEAKLLSPQNTRKKPVIAKSTTKKRKDVLTKLAETRAKDQRFIKEQVEHHKEMREQRFERLLSGVTGDDIYLKGYVTEILRTQQLQYTKKCGNMFLDWNSKVYDNIQKQLNGFLNPPDRSVLQSISGGRSVEFKIPDEKPVITTSPADNPTYSGLMKEYNENKFRRAMDLVCKPDVPLSEILRNRYSNLEGNLKYHDQLDPNTVGYNADEPIRPVVHPMLARSKPVLEPMSWGQLELQGTPFGHFAQVCAHGAGFKTSVKTGNHVPPEDDGVETAGKRKTRWTRNDLGILKGEIATRGQTIENKTHYGASSGAPNQDHFTYEGGARVVDTEFPLGKRMLAHKH